MRLSVLRHGETPLSGRFCGRLDPELTPEGRKEMQARCAGRQWDIVVSSPARRCADFAWEHAADCRIDEGFHELDFGDWDGKETAELWQAEPEALQRFWDDPDGAPPPRGERWSEMRARVHSSMMVLIDHAATEDARSLLLVTHAGVMRALLELYLSIPLAAAWNIALPPAAMMELEMFRDENERACRAMLRGLTT